ncbi:hypothetical protein ACLOJK_040700 [Asimina triloba]
MLRLQSQTEEAYVKAIGRGFSAAPFSSFTLRFRAGKRMKNPGETSSNNSSDVKEATRDGEPTVEMTLWVIPYMDAGPLCFPGHSSAGCLMLS